MTYEVIPTEGFARDLRRLIKKFPSLRGELAVLSEQLASDPLMGTHLGHHCYKIRLSIRSKGKGKRGSSRILTLVRSINKTVYLVAIYDKSERSMITDADLQKIIRGISI